ncbi:MAG TPA: cyclase family protein [Thermomicrobiales bacterium]
MPVIDLSHPIDANVPMFPGHPGPVIEEYLSRAASEASYAPGTSFVIHRYSFLGNTGTYLDAPFHRFADGEDLATLPLTSTVDLPGVVIDARPAVSMGEFGIGPGNVRSVSVDVRGRAVLLLTGWDRHWGTPAYLGEKPYLTGEAAAILREYGAALVGIDTWNIDDVADRTRPAHTVLLRGGIPIVENLRGLDALPPFDFRFFAAPLPIRGGSAIPVRAFAIV